MVEPLGSSWVAFSPACGETVLLNDACAALLEVLAEQPATTEQACALIALDTGDDPADLREAVEQSWGLLVDSGLVVALTTGQHLPP